MGIAGIPAASLVGIAIILSAVGLPAEAIGVLLVFDRLLDMCRTAINVLADAACTVIVSSPPSTIEAVAGAAITGARSTLFTVITVLAEPESALAAVKVTR